MNPAGNYSNMKISQGFQLGERNKVYFGLLKRRSIPDSDEDLLKIERKRIKNRVSAAKSRDKKLERMKFLEEKVEELGEENTQMKRLIKLMEIEQEEEKAEASTVTKHRRSCSW